jgi:hypothetical protein
MNWNDFLNKMKRYEGNAAVIFDDEEPVGRPTDLVLPDKRWFGRKKNSQSINGSREVAESRK